MSDCERILAALEARGELTSYEIRTEGLSGNPSQRINELRDRGYEIEGVPASREVHGQKRPMTIYKLRRVGTPNDGRANSGGPRKFAEGYGGSLTGGAVDSHSRGGGSGRKPKHPAAISGLTGPEGQGNEPAGGADKGSPVARLFDLDPPVTGGYYEREAAA